VTRSDLGTFPSAVAHINCGGDHHTVRWEAGELISVDHGDPDGERALAALGGSSLECIDVLNAWARHRRDPRLLSALTRGFSDHVRPETDRHRAVPQGRPPGAVPGRPPGISMRGMGSYTVMVGANMLISSGPSSATMEPLGSDDFIALLAGLDRDVAMRLAATVTAGLLDGNVAGVGAVLEASLFGRVANSLVTWLGDPGLRLTLEVVQPGEPEFVEEGPEGDLRVALPLRWVTEVWGRGLAIVAGRFALAVVEATAHRVELETISSDFGPPRTLAVELS
jgi:hypothetical protein